MPATPVWLAAAEALLNRGVQGSAQAGALAQRLNATSLLVCIEGFTAIRARIAMGHLSLLAAGPQATPAQESDAPDSAAHDNATLSGSPFALLRLAEGGSGGRSASHTAHVRGDAEVANLYRQLFYLARPDLEEELSRVVGDFPARRFAELTKRTLAWATRVRRTASENVAEYLQEESRDLVNKPELEEFLHGVDALRETADRVEARLSRLERRLKGQV